MKNERVRALIADDEPRARQFLEKSGFSECESTYLQGNGAS